MPPGPLPRCFTSTSTSVPSCDERLARAVQVALAVRRVLEELAEPRQVALRRRDVGVGLDRVEPDSSAGSHRCVVARGTST